MKDNPAVHVKYIVRYLLDQECDLPEILGILTGALAYNLGCAPDEEVMETAIETVTKQLASLSRTTYMLAKEKPNADNP